MVARTLLLVSLLAACAGRGEPVRPSATEPDDALRGVGRSAQAEVTAAEITPDPGAAPPQVTPSPGAAPPQEAQHAELARHDGSLYAVAGSVIRRADLDPAAATVSASRPIIDVSGRLRIARIAVGGAGVAFIGQVIENNQFTRRGKIVVAAHDGSGLREVWSGAGDQYDIGLHGDQVVWTNMELDARLGVLDEESGSLMRVPFAGGAASVIAPVDHPRALQIVGADAFVAARGAVVRIPLGGGGPPQTFPVALPIDALAVDASAIVLSDMSTGALWSIPRDGGAARSIAALGCVRGLALDARYVYVACGHLTRVERTGGPATQLTPSAVTPSFNAVTLASGRVWGYSALEDRFVSAPL